jgi:putative (di)nucleoside polyphosphate hydrolase
MALTELARFLPRINHHNRYLRGGPRQGRREANGSFDEALAPEEFPAEAPQPQPPQDA